MNIAFIMYKGIEFEVTVLRLWKI